MTYLTIDEINSSRIYAPIFDEEDKINFMIRISGEENVINEVLGLTEDDVDSLFEEPKMNIDLQNEIKNFEKIEYDSTNNDLSKKED